MARHPITISARNPNTGTIHHVFIEAGFAALPFGAALPAGAIARTACLGGPRLDATGYRVTGVGDPRFRTARVCGFE
jgi:hypothetical protein